MVNLRDRRHGALTAAARGALFNAHGRRQAGNEIHVRSRHLLHELASVGIHGVEESALSLGEKKIKCERALAGAADASNDHEFPARNLQGNVFQIVFTRTEDADDFFIGRKQFKFGIQAAPLVTCGEPRAMARHPTIGDFEIEK